MRLFLAQNVGYIRRHDRFTSEADEWSTSLMTRNGPQPRVPHEVATPALSNKSGHEDPSPRPTRERYVLCFLPNQTSKSMGILATPSAAGSARSEVLATRCARLTQFGTRRAQRGKKKWTFRRLEKMHFAPRLGWHLPGGNARTLGAFASASSRTRSRMDQHVALGSWEWWRKHPVALSQASKGLP